MLPQEPDNIEITFSTLHVSPQSLNDPQFCPEAFSFPFQSGPIYPNKYPNELVHTVFKMTQDQIFSHSMPLAPKSYCPKKQGTLPATPLALIAHHSKNLPTLKLLTNSFNIIWIFVSYKKTKSNFWNQIKDLMIFLLSLSSPNIPRESLSSFTNWHAVPSSSTNFPPTTYCPYTVHHAIQLF